MAERIEGRYFFKKSSRGHAATLTERGNKVTIAPEYKTEFRAARTEIESIQGKRDVYLAGGGYFRANADLPRGFGSASTGRMTRLINAFSVITPVRAFIMVAVLVCSIAGLRLAFTAFAALTVVIFPHDWERAIGSAAWTQIESFYEMQPTELPDARIALLNEQAGAMAAAAGFAPVPEIHFRNAPDLGANALALPGGPIVLTDDLVNLMDDEEVLAVIAHEFAHVEKRHALHQTVEVAGVFVFFMILFGAEEGVIEIMADSAAVLWGLSLSRDHEFEADARAAEMMAAAMRDPLAMAEGLDALRHAYCDDVDESGQPNLDECDAVEGFFNWVSTHPPTRERIEAIREIHGHGH